jgi:hypothetical protein
MKMKTYYKADALQRRENPLQERRDSYYKAEIIRQEKERIPVTRLIATVRNNGAHYMASPFTREMNLLQGGEGRLTYSHYRSGLPSGFTSGQLAL